MAVVDHQLRVEVSGSELSFSRTIVAPLVGGLEKRGKQSESLESRETLQAKKKLTAERGKHLYNERGKTEKKKGRLNERRPRERRKA